MTTLPALTADELRYLGSVTTPTLSNAIERLRLRPNTAGFADPTIRPVFPEFGTVVGYAVTAVVRASTPPSRSKIRSRKEYWDRILKHPAPRIVVIHDLDQPPVGAFWGEVNANIHRALGCVAAVTDGTVRDLDEVRALGFPFFAAGVSVSHAYCHLEEFDVPVTVGGLTVHPGDLIHADRHGVLSIPREAVPALPGAVKGVEDFERPIIRLCQSPEFSTEELARLLESASE